MRYNISLEDYSFVDNNVNEMWAIRLNDKWPGLVYCYGKVTAQLLEDNSDQASLKFQYQIIDEGDYDKDELAKDPNFNDYLGDVLSHIIQDAFDNEKYRIGNDDSNDSAKEPSNQ